MWEQQYFIYWFTDIYLLTPIPILRQINLFPGIFMENRKKTKLFPVFYSRKSSKEG